MCLSEYFYVVFLRLLSTVQLNMCESIADEYYPFGPFQTSSFTSDEFNA